jgi:hypothetical protein
LIIFMEVIVRRVKELKNRTYNQYTGEQIFSELNLVKETDSQMFCALSLLDNVTITEATFNADTSACNTLEGFIWAFTHRIIERGSSSYVELAKYLGGIRRELTFSKICYGILLLQNLSAKTHEEDFKSATREFLNLVDLFYKTLFELFFHGTKELTDSEQGAVIKTGYAKVSAAIGTFIKHNKKLLEWTGRFTPLKITDFLSFDGVTVTKYNKLSTSVINSHEFLRFLGNLYARLDYIAYFVDSQQGKESHEIVQFRDARTFLKPFEEKLTLDPLGIVEAESGYFQYRKYHVLSLRNDKVFNLHKSIVPNSEQPDDHLLPANETWEGYGGLYALYLIRSFLIKDKSYTACLSPHKLLKLIFHVLSNIPEPVYTGGDWFIPLIEYLHQVIEWSDYPTFKNTAEDNIFLFDLFVAFKRMDFNIKLTNKPKLTELFISLMNRVESRQTRYFFLTKFLDMDYHETFFQTGAMTTGILRILHHEIEQAKYEAFDRPDIFLRKDMIEKIWGHVEKADHKQLGSLRTGMRYFLDIIKTLREFNAYDWHPENTLSKFYETLDSTKFDTLKKAFVQRVAECVEVEDRKNRNILSADVLKVVNDEFIRSCRAEAADLKGIIRFVEDIKFAYMDR